VNRFEEEVLVRWAHTDPAGIVFYPRYFEMINALVEDWFAGPLDCDFETLHGELGAGVPTLSIECEFARPSRLGDRLVFELGVERMGESSFTLDVVATDRYGEQRVKAHLVLACIDLETGRARPIPDEIRSRMVEFELRRAG
jgi:4-hydroxybenzoyl-CoA thioesterase